MSTDTQPLIHHIVLHDEPESSPHPREKIKRQLKGIVNQSNALQDAVNYLKDMKQDHVSLQRRVEQRNYIDNLVVAQNKAINYLNHLEYIFPDRKNKRFFYFKQVTIPEP